MRVWLKPAQMAALGISPSEVYDALARNNYLSALGRTKGSMVSVNLIANTDLKTPEEFRQLVVKEKDGVVVRLGEIADVVLGAENYEADVRFNGQTATFMGIWVLPTANSLDVIGRVRHGDRRDRAPAARPGCGWASRTTRRLHPGRDPRGAEDPQRDAADRDRRDLPVPRLAARRDHPGRRDPDLAGRGRLPDAGGGLHDQPAHAARDRALGRPGGRRRDRDGRERRAPPARGRAAPAGGARRRARAGRADRGHDDHARRRLHARRDPGRPDGRPLPRVRLHARRGRDRVRRRGPDAVADDGLAAAARGRQPARLRRLGEPPLRRGARGLHPRARLDAGRSAGGAGASG